ncbi:MAG: hypothetical protein GXO16_04240 [Epsilonproteobacteria bacterium]|nr:hypothetical protein [Campylobacterota bacterium]
MSIGSFARFDKRYALFLFAVGIWVWMGYSIASHTAKKIIKATIIQSKKPIRHIDDTIEPQKREILWIDTLNFPKGNELRHPKYGYLGYRRNFIAYFDTDIEVPKDRYVDFVIYSDDGFRLTIDGKKIMEYPKDRPFQKSEKIVKLTKGRHHLRIKYFQGYGQLGIVGYYGTAQTEAAARGAKKYLIGESSSALKFLEQ